MNRFLSACRTFHGWLGAFVMPWVVVIGMTGLYLNHSRMFAPLLAQSEFNEAGLDRLKAPAPITRAAARRLGETLWSDQPIKKIWQRNYHGRPSFFVHKARGNIIVAIPTGHYYLRTRYRRRTYTSGGELLDTKIYWGRAFKDIHVTGWMGGALGTWLADAVAIAMMLFGFTGIFMWSAPKIRRLRRRFKSAPESK